VTPPDDAHRTVGGLAGKAVGKVTEALGHATDGDGREREVRAELARVADQVAAEQREAQIEGKTPA
jgi:uncharacterized protein YjbJ (UPF0337 family)